MGYYNKLSVEFLGDKNQAEILRFLYRNRPNRFSQRQISAALNIPPASISRACKKLVRFNIVESFPVGKSILYRLDETSYVVKRILVPIFKNEEHLFPDLIKDILKTITPQLTKYIKEIILFGSIARNEDTTESDIDLAIVIDAWATPLRTNKLMQKRIKEIEEHFIHESVKRNIHLDIHLFVEG